MCIRDRLDTVDDTTAFMSELGKKQRRVKIGIPQMIGTFLFPRLFRDFKAKNPQIRLDLTEGGSPELLRAVEEDELDLAIIISNDINSPDICIKHIYDTEFYLCTGRKNPFSSKAKASLEEIKHESFILFKDGYYQNKLIRERFSEINAEPDILLNTNQIVTIKNMIENDIACSFLIKEVIEDDTDICGIPLDPPVPIQIGVILSLIHICEKLNLATFIPSSIMLSSTSKSSVAGPKVQTIFVFLIYLPPP